MRENICVSALIDQMINTLRDASEQYEFYSHTESDGRLLEAHMSEIARKIKIRCDAFVCNNLKSRVNIYIRVLGDVSVLACSLLTKGISPDVNIDLNVIHKESDAGMVLYILSSEAMEIKDDFTHIENVDALNTNLSTAASFVKTTDGATVEIKPVDVNKYKGVNLQDNLWRMLMQSLDET